MFRTKRVLAARRVAVAGAIVLLPLAALAAPAAADPATPAPGYTQVDRDHHRDRDRSHHHRDRDRGHKHHRGHNHHRHHDDHWNRGHDRHWDHPAPLFRHLLRGAFGSS